MNDSASVPNINAATGIRYGAIKGDSLDPEVLDQLYLKASAKVYDEMRAQRRRELMNQLSTLFDCVPDDELESECKSVFERQLDTEAEGGAFGCDEPGAEIVHEGVTLHYGYLGGAVLVLVIDSPYSVAVSSLCSPCVPNAGDLDSGIEAGGHWTYTVPPDWLDKGW